MNYSRKQLIAFGEPMGECVTRKEGGRIIYGGGGSSSPSSTTQTTELPEWARGYAKDALGKAAALTDTSQNPYQAYGADRIAGFSPMQQQSQQNAANMQTSGLTGMAGQMAGAATMGALGANYDPTQFQAGQFGGKEAQQYMSPYMQNVVDIQQREAQRQGDIAGTQRNAQAVGAGAFGGSRQAIMDSEAARNLATQKGDIQAQGLQSSYQQAQNQFNADQARQMQAQQLGEQSKQYGAGLGMQGLQTALQGAGQMGALGQQQFGQSMDINKLQNAYGGQQQALQQQGLTQAYQDFQNQQNYPYKQLGFMSDMIRGLPLGQQSTSQMYEAAPSTAQQIGSIGMGAMGLSKFMAEGGAVKGYARGGGVDSQENVKNIVDSLSPQQMSKSMEAAQARGDREQMQALQDEMGFQASLKRGLAGTVTPDMAQRMAGGGAVAFAKGGAPSISDALERMRNAGGSYTPPSSEESIENAKTNLPGLQSLLGESKTAPYMEENKAERAAIKAGRPEDEAAMWIAGAKGIRQGSGLFAGLGNAAVLAGEEGVKMKKQAREADRLLRASEIQLATADQARSDGIVGKALDREDKAQSMAEKAAKLNVEVAEKELTAATSMRNADVQAAATTGKKTFEQESAIAKFEAALAADPSIATNPAKLAATKEKAFTDTAKETRAASSLPEKLQQATLVAEGKTAEKADARLDAALKSNGPYLKAMNQGKFDEAARIREQVRGTLVAPEGPSAGAPAAGARAPIKIASKAEFDKLPSGTTFIAPDGSTRTKP